MPTVACKSEVLNQMRGVGSYQQQEEEEEEETEHLPQLPPRGGPGVVTRQAPLEGFLGEVTLKSAVCRLECNRFSHSGGRQIGEEGPGYRLEMGVPLNTVHLCQAGQRPRCPQPSLLSESWVEKAPMLQGALGLFTRRERAQLLAENLGSP